MTDTNGQNTTQIFNPPKNTRFEMRTTARVLLVLFISVPWLGCKNQNQPQVIQGTGDEISAEQIAIEEEELETTE